MGLDFWYTEPGCGEPDTRPAIIAQVHYMYFALILFWLTVIISLVVSYFTSPPDESQVSISLIIVTANIINGRTTRTLDLSAKSSGALTQLTKKICRN